MNDNEARLYLAIIEKSQLITKLFEADSWYELEFTSLECAALAAWKLVATLRPDVAVALYTDLWQPEYALIQQYLAETETLPGAMFCPNCGKGWLISVIDSDPESPADCTYCEKRFSPEELDSLDI